MWKLSTKLALSNLLKNRILYIPFVLVSVLAAAFTYIFISLAKNPQISQVWGSTGIQTVLNFGLHVVMITVVMMILYANSFVMKKRSKEIGLYSILGMDKRHLLLMTLIETIFLGLLTILLGTAIGALLDKLFYAILLKMMRMPVALISTFQWTTVLLVLEYFSVIFLVIWLFNAGKFGFTSSLNMIKDKKKGEKKGRFLWLQALIGLGLLGLAYFMAQQITSPLQAMNNFIIAVILVIVATYILFNAGIISLLRFLKNRPAYYYKPANFISVSNLIFRMRKNAMGLATIAILSTMVLVTMVGVVNIYTNAENYIAKSYPNDFYVELQPNLIENGATTGTKEEADAYVKASLTKSNPKGIKMVQYDYQGAFIKENSGNRIRTFLDGAISGGGPDTFDVGYVTLVSQSDYKKMTGEKVQLSQNEVLLYSAGKRFDREKSLTFNGKDYRIKKELTSDFVSQKIPTTVSLFVTTNIILVVPDGNHLLPENNTHFYYGMDVGMSKQKQEKLYGKLLNDFMTDSALEFPFNNWNIASRADFEKSFYAIAGSVLFIGVILSVIFLMTTVLVIYYKQISEGFEDRDRFVTMQKVGLDETETKRSIRQQMLTIFLLPVGIAVIHLAAAYKMLTMILKMMVMTSNSLMFTVSLVTVLIYLLAYFAVYILTSRSYHKIISR